MDDSTAEMKLGQEVCAKCGGRLSSDSPFGLCVRCLVDLGTSEASEPAQEGSSSSLMSARPLLPRLFGQYELIEEIARGGMGVIFRARQIKLNRDVAVKMILYGSFAGQSHVERFLAEAQSVAKLRHPNIIAVHEVGVEEGQPFFSMEYVPGQSLADMVREKPLPPRQAARYVSIVARAIGYAHSLQVLHRDLKPSNILIDKDDEPRVTDFGLARRLDQDSDLTLSGHPLGTPSYMPPEQVAVKRSRLGPASDIYSLGAILYHLLTGRPPFMADSLAQTFEQILHADPLPLRLLNANVPRDLETICLKCLEKDPGKRYSSAVSLADELGRFLRHESIEARPASLLEKCARWCKRRPKVAIPVAGTSVIITILLLIVLDQWRRAELANAQSQEMARETELRLADVRLNHGQSLEGLATLARLARKNPTDPVTVNRLFTELNYQTFAHPVGSRIHDGETVWSANLSSNERLLVTTTETNSAFLWGSVGEANPVLLHRLAHPKSVYLARFSPDDRSVATVCADQQIRLWNSETGVLDGAPLKHGTEVAAFCFSPKGDQIASVLADGSVWVWDLAERRVKFMFPPGKGALPYNENSVQLMRIHDWTVVSYTPDGSKLLCGVNTAAPRLWDTQTGTLLKEFQHGSSVLTCEFDPDGTHVLTSSRDGSVRIWDLLTGVAVAKEQYLPTTPIQAHFSPDGNRVATGFYNHAVSIWDAATGDATCPPLRHKNYVQDTCFSSDGRTLLVADHDGSAHVWSVREAQEVAAPVQAGVSLRAARFLKDGQHFMTRGSDGVQFWKLAKASSSMMMSARGGSQIYAACLQGDGHAFVTVNGRQVCNVWSSQNGELLETNLVEPGKFFREANSPDDPYCKRFVAAALLWERRSGRKLAQFLKPNEHLSCFAAVEDGKRIALGMNAGGGRVVNLSLGDSKTVTLDSSSVFVSIEFSADGQRIVTSSFDSTARVWNAFSGEPTTPPLQHKGPVIAAHINTSGNCLVTRGYFPGAYVWELKEKGPSERFLSHGSEVLDVRFDETGERIVTASADWTAQVWNASDARPIGYPLRHELDVRQALFLRDGSQIVSACADGTVRHWDVSTSMPLGVLLRTGEALDSLNLNDAGTEIVCGGLEGNTYRCELAVAPTPAPGWLPELAESLAGEREVNPSVLQPLPSGTLFDLERRLSALPENEFYSRWVRHRFASQQIASH